MMIRKLISISLILSISLTLVRFTIPYLWYYSNFEHVAEELCIHKDDPDHVCDGYCQVVKMVKDKHDHEEQQRTVPVEREKKINLCFTVRTAAPQPPLPIHVFASRIHATSALWFGEPISPPPQTA